MPTDKKYDKDHPVIRIDIDLKEYLDEVGKKKETYSDIIKRLIKFKK